MFVFPGKCLKNLQFWSLGDKSSPTRSINATPYSSMGFFVSDQLNRRLTEPRDLILPKENDEVIKIKLFTMN